MKTRNFLMVGILLLTLILSVSAADIVVTPQNSTLADGDVADLTVSVQNVENLGGFDIELHWDPSVVVLDTESGNVTIGPLFAGHVNNSAVYRQSGRVRVAALNATLDGVSGSADLFTVHLQAVDNTGKSTPVSVVVNNYGFLNSMNGNDIPVASITNATVTTQRANRVTAGVGAASSNVAVGARTVAVFTVANQRSIPTSAMTVTTTISAPNGSVVNTTEQSGVVLPAYGQHVLRTEWTPATAGIYTLNITVTSDTSLPVVGTTTAYRQVTARAYSLEMSDSVYGYNRAAVDNWFSMGWYVRPSESGNVMLNLTVPDGVEVYGGANCTRWMGGNYWNYVGYWMKVSTPGTLSADSFNLTVSANGKAVSKTSDHDVLIWIPSIQVTSVGSVSVPDDGTDPFSTTYNTLHTNNTYDNVTTITAQSGARGRTLSGLGYLVNYPYGCVEQTASQMLASLNVKDYYLNRSDRPSDYTSIRERANESVAGGVDRLVNGGERGQHDDGGWSLWGYGDSESSSSSYAAYTLARVNESSEDLNRLLNDRISTGESVDLNSVNFEKLVEWFHENPDNRESGTWTWSAGVCHAWTPTSNTGFVMLIHAMIRDQGTISDPYATYMTENMQNATRYFVETQTPDGSWGGDDDTAMATALGLWGLESYGLPSSSVTSANVTQDQIDSAKEKAAAWLVDHQNDDGSWNADSYYGWYDNGRKTESTAYAVLALNATGLPADNEHIQKGVNWLIDQYESGGGWGYTWATQAAIDALIHCQPEEVSSGTVTVSIDGTDVCTLTVDATNPQVTYTLTDDQMEAMMASGSRLRTISDYSIVKTHDVSVTRSGGNGLILVTAENSQRAPVNEIDATIRNSGTIQSIDGGIPDSNMPAVSSLSENLNVFGEEGALQAMIGSVTLASNPSPLVANESGQLTLTVQPDKDVLSPLIEIPIEGFTFANGTISENDQQVSYEVLNSSVSDNSTSVYIEPDHWSEGTTYTYAFDVTPSGVGDLGFNLRFRPLYDEQNVTLVEKHLTVTGRGSVAVQVTDGTGAPVSAAITLDSQSVVASSHTFEDLLAGTYQLSVSKEDHIPVNTTVNVTANDEYNVTVTMPTDLSTPRLILSQGSGSLGGVSSVPGVLSAGFAENATYNVTLIGNGGEMVLALEFPERFMLHDPVVRLNGVVLNSSEYEIRNGTFEYDGPNTPYASTNTTLIIYDAPDGVNEIGISLQGDAWGDADGKMWNNRYITMNDAMFVAQSSVNIRSLMTYDYPDVTGDGKINMNDAMFIAQKSVGLRDSTYQWIG